MAMSARLPHTGGGDQAKYLLLPDVHHFSYGGSDEAPNLNDARRACSRRIGVLLL
jgi:hypothetical protein